jgi:hypothetical protein
MKDYLETIKNATLPLNEKGELKQNVRNAFRSDFVQALFTALVGLGLEVKITEDGIGIEIPNTELGSVPVVVSATVKDLSYSVDLENEAYLDKLEAKAEAERVKAELKARNLAEKEANKLAKAKKPTK